MEANKKQHGACSKIGEEYQNLKSKVGSLKGKTVFITGASKGIGKAIGLKAAADGANIVVLARSDRSTPERPDSIYTAAEAMREAGGKALALKCDIRDAEQVKECIEKAVEVFGGIDILINNASALNLRTTEELNIDQ